MPGPDFNDILNQFFNAKMAGIHTALPGIVKSYDPETQKAEVQPAIKKKYRDGETESMPIITGVPVMFPRVGNASLTFPIEDGDTVLLIFAERNIENFLNQGGEQEPADNTKFSLSDAVALPGLFPFTEDNPDPAGEDLTLKFGDSEIRMTPDGDITITGTNSISVTNGTGTLAINDDNQVAFGNTTDELLDLIETMWTELIAHTHPTAATGPPSPPTNAVAITAIQARLTAIKGTL